ncbi:MAG: DUF2764 family protein [Bacteroidales bacterium]|nr:DUF2764 family protein [Bacteroidales bacterium]
MNNYEYIIAGLPFLSQDGREAPDTEAILADIREQLSEKDAKTLDFLLSAYAPDMPDAAFYLEAQKSRNRFIREFFALDLGVRNAKVEYLNRSLGRPEGTDVVNPDPEKDLPEFDQEPELDAILETDDILGRERALDNFYWKSADALTVLDVFDLDLILAFVVKLKQVERWLKLDEATGRELFRKLVKEIKENTKI